MNNQLQLAISVLEDMIERVDVQAYESPNSEDRVYAGHKWNAFIEARRAILAVLAIDTLAAICRATAPFAPDTAAFKAGDRVWHASFHESGTVIAIETEPRDSPENWIVTRRDGFPASDKFKYLERNLSLYYDQPQPSPSPASATASLSKAQRQTLKEIQDGTFVFGRGKSVVLDKLKREGLWDWSGSGALDRALTPAGIAALARR